MAWRFRRSMTVALWILVDALAMTWLGLAIVRLQAPAGVPETPDAEEEVLPSTAEVTHLQAVALENGEDPIECSSHKPPLVPTYGFVEGYVFDQYGEPVAGACVAFSGSRSGSVMTRTGGAFRFQVPEGRELSVWCIGRGPSDDGRSEACLGTNTLVAKAGDKDLILRASSWRLDAIARLRVLDPEGNPVEGILVTVRDVPLRTDFSGRVTLCNLATFPFYPAIAPSGDVTLGSDWVMPRGEPVVPGGCESVRQYRHAIHLDGRVLSPDGCGEANVGIRALRDDGEEAGTARSGGDGSFSVLLDPERPEPVRLEALVGGEGNERVATAMNGWIPGGTPAVLQLPGK